jgi:hypothetical protein
MYSIRTPSLIPNYFCCTIRYGYRVRTLTSCWVQRSLILLVFQISSPLTIWSAPVPIQLIVLRPHFSPGHTSTFCTSTCTNTCTSTYLPAPACYLSASTSTFGLACSAINPTKYPQTHFPSHSCPDRLMKCLDSDGFILSAGHRNQRVC